VAIDVLPAAAVILKGKPLLGLVGIFVPLASLVGIVRLASPGSWWARCIYGQGRKRERAQARRVSRLRRSRRTLRTDRIDQAEGASSNPSTPDTLATRRSAEVTQRRHEPRERNHGRLRSH
jgi:hypothetical protein